MSFFFRIGQVGNCLVAHSTILVLKKQIGENINQLKLSSGDFPGG